MATKNKSRVLSIAAAIFILALGVLVGGYLVLKSGNIQASQLSTILEGKNFDSGVCTPNANDSNKDSDDDGLKDWQELQVYKSDACKQDTDGDGYLDGEEVQSGYDPTIKAPGDELPGTVPKTPRPLPANLTKYLSQQLSEDFLAGKIDSFTASGSVLSESDLAEYPAIQESIWEMKLASDSLFKAEEIDDSKIKVSNDNSKESFQKYSQQVKSAILPKGTSTNKQGETTELDLIAEFIEKGDFSQLEPALEIYRSIYLDLSQIAVPSDFLEIHKRQLSIFSKMIKIYEGLQNSQEDPLKAFFAVQAYQEVVKEIDSWSSDFIQIVNENYLTK